MVMEQESKHQHFSMAEANLLQDFGVTEYMINRMEQTASAGGQSLPDLAKEGVQRNLQDVQNLRNRIEESWARNDSMLRQYGDPHTRGIDGILDKWFRDHKDIPIQRLLDWGSPPPTGKRISPARWERMKRETESFWKLASKVDEFWD